MEQPRSPKGTSAIAYLAQEVLVKTARVDRVLELRKFADRGVAHYWIVDPAAETLEALELAEGSYRVVFASDIEGVFEPPLFPGLRIPIRDLFR
jgi:Uma2 family endonuclease